MGREESRYSCLDMTIAIVIGALVGAHLLRSGLAHEPDAALRKAIARRDAVAQDLEEAKTALVLERERQAEEIRNLSVSLGGSWLEKRESLKKEESRKLIGSVLENAQRLNRWNDFPCTLRELKVARVTKTCEIACRESRCERAQRLCDRLVECDAVLVKPPGENEEVILQEGHTTDLANVQARLVRDTGKAKHLDTSLQLLSASRWWHSPSLQRETYKPRTYLVVSYGGCGSKMLAGWLSSLEGTTQPIPKRPGVRRQESFKKGGQAPRYVKRVYHLHDASPPLALRELPSPRAPPSNQRDFRARRFYGGGKFRADLPLIPESNLDDYRVLFIFKDPVEALVSRYGYGHCMHLNGNCGPDERTFPKLDAYARRGTDNMNILSFFQNYVTPDPKRSFPIILLNYHKLWDNLEALMAALGLPPHLASTFPERTETVRNDLTAKAEGNQAHSEATRKNLDAIYQPIIKRIQELPAVSLV